MKSKILLIGCIGAVILGATACHHDDNGSPSTPPTTSGNMALDTAQVLTMAQATSETSSPVAVNGGALTLTDTSETSTPISVN